MSKAVLPSRRILNSCMSNVSDSLKTGIVCCTAYELFRITPTPSENSSLIDSYSGRSGQISKLWGALQRMNDKRDGFSEDIARKSEIIRLENREAPLQTRF